VYIVNLMSQPGETTDLRASDHLAAVLAHTGRRTSQPLIDMCVVNTRAIPAKALAHYRRQAARPVENDVANLERLGCAVLAADLLRKSARSADPKVRHDSGVLGAVAIELAQRGRHKKRKHI
jgi:2-phospho-L-lactate transferase/gluconeogenesis factor (CofD/UPF0052 family)